MAEKPKMQNSESQKQIDKAEKDFEKFKDQVDTLTLDRMNEAPKLEVEPQTKIAQADLDKSDETYLKPSNFVMDINKFDEKYRDRYNFDKEYVAFIAEHNEQSDLIEIWTKPYRGVPAEFWKVPCKRLVWGPRYLAEQITKCKYHRMRTEEKPVQADRGMHYYGSMVVDNTIQRLDARPASTRRSIFMGANS